MSIQQIDDFHELKLHSDYACTGFFAGNIEEHSQPLNDIYSNYPASISTKSKILMFKNLI